MRRKETGRGEKRPPGEFRDGEEARVAELVRQVVGAAVEDRGLAGVVLGAPPGPERALLARWLSPQIRVSIPSEEEVEPVAAALAPALDETGRATHEEAWMAVARRSARKRGLLLVHPAHKSILLLEGPLAPCFPLGDLWGHRLCAWTETGTVTIPAPLRAEAPEVLGPVEQALARWLEEGVPMAHAFTGVPEPTAERVRAALGAGRALAKAPLVPKLSSWTLGLDPAP